MSISIPNQRAAWNSWNASANRSQSLGEISAEQWRAMHRWLDGKTNLTIIDVGCGDGWLVEKLLRYGRVYGTDLADEVIARAQVRCPSAKFTAGDFMAMQLPCAYDVVTTCEVLSHVEDQPAFIAKLASLLMPGGELMMATQNRWALSRNAAIGPAKGYVRNWVTTSELRRLLEPHFEVLELRTVGPFVYTGIWRVLNDGRTGRLIGTLLGHKRWQRLRGWLGCGWTIMVRARVK